MMEHSFIDVFKTIENIYSDAVNGTNLYPESGDKLAKALNSYFDKFKCKEVVINKNFDKPLFGLFLRPAGYTGQKLINAMLPDYFDASVYFSSFTFDSYYLEIDLKLIRELNLDILELTALILNYVYVMSTADPSYRMRVLIDRYLAEHNRTLNTYEMIKHASIFEMVFHITLNNIYSVFCTARQLDEAIDYEVPAFLVSHGQGLAEAYTSMMRKITASSSDLQLQYNTELILLSWYFENYLGFDSNRWIENMFRDSMETEASILIKRLIVQSYTSLTEIPYSDMRIYNALVTESSKKKGLIYKIKRDGIKSIEEDLFEYQMRLRNVETQDEAILLMRQLNSRMSILEDYLREEDLDDADRERWEKCYSGYLEVRDALSKKTVYSRKMYGLFVDYNALQQMSQNGQLY